MAGYDHDPGSGFVYLTSLFKSVGGTNFVNADVSLPGLEISGPALWGDVDNDRDLDLLLIGQLDPWQYMTRLYRNDLGTLNYAPESPSDLEAEFDGPLVRLRWEPARDPNQTARLSYNVRVGTAPGRDDVVGPMARSDGWRLIPAPGNAGFAQHKLVTGLIPGRTYYWSVQAVDHAFVGSEFAGETSFFLSDPPLIGPIADQTLPEDESTPPLAIVLSDADDPAVEIAVSAEAANADLVPPTGMTFAGEGALRTLSVTPATNRFGATTITVTVRDPHGANSRRSFLLTVLPVNDPPVARPQSATLAEDTSLVLALEAEDPDSDALSVLVERPPRFGALQTGLGGATNRPVEVRYTPGRDYFGGDSFAYRVTDGRESSESVEVTLWMTAIPDRLEVELFVGWDATGQLWLEVLGEPRQRYRVDASSDLRDWKALFTLEGSSNLVRSRDDAAAGHTVRFYRLVPVP